MGVRHVAIIPDGNRRWARAKGLAAVQGHREAVRNERVRSFLQKAKELGIAVVSLWVFSTENWKRPEAERKALFALLEEQIDALGAVANDENVRVRWIGRRDRVPHTEKLEALEASTKDNDALTLQLCLDYGGRDEILRAVNKAVDAGSPVDEDSFTRLLDTKDIPDPDLIIRTSGEQRLSGFMPWQATYAELFFTDKHFPDFGPDDLAAAVEAFNQRQRRFGGG